ncbi:MAG: ABC transporter permease [Actinomycetota bacterium]|nr:ABC transporter permease [Actinomycetota bacterium]
MSLGGGISVPGGDPPGEAVASPQASVAAAPEPARSLSALVRAALVERNGSRVVLSAIAAVVAFALGAVALVANGISPWAAYSALFSGSFGSAQSLASTAVQTAPLLVASLAVGISFRAGVFNIGAGGQLGVGALAAGIVGGYVHLGTGVELLAMAAASLVAGGLWAAVPGLLKAYTGANEVITTLMLTYVAADLIDYAVTGPAKASGAINQTPQLAGSALLPTLVGNTQLTAAILVGIALVPLVWLLLFRTTYGMRLRMVGLNPGTAAAAGFSVRRVGVSVLALSGALAGLAGMLEVSGVLGSVPQNMSLQVGYTAIVVALLGNNGPAGILLASVFLGALTAGSTTMQSAVGVSGPFVVFLEGIMIGSVVGMPAIARGLARRRRGEARAAGAR